MRSKILFILVASLPLYHSFGQSSGQNYTLSPYSNFGLGELLNSNIAEAGYLGQTYSGNYGYSFLNPATLGNLKYTTFDFALNYRYGLTQTGAEERNFKGGSMNYLSLAFNVVNRKIPKFSDSAGQKKIVKTTPLVWNSFAGLYPMSSVGYNYTVENNNPFLNRTAHSGKGGVNLAEWGNSLSIGKHLNLGYSIGYMFGQLTDRSVFSVPDSADLFIIDDEKTVNIKGYRQQAGIMYQFKWDSTYHRFGASYRWYGGAKAADLRFTRIYGYTSGSLSSVDTILSESNPNRRFTMPAGFGLGYTFQYRQRWSLGLDYYREQWGNYSAFFQPGQKLANREDYGVSFVWNPQDERPAKLKKMPVSIRLGARMANTQNVFTPVAGNSPVVIREKAAYVGFGIPFSRRYYDGQILRSMVNVRLDYMSRGSLSGGLAREQFYVATFSFNLGDVWFQRKKFD